MRSSVWKSAIPSVRKWFAAYLRADRQMRRERIADFLIGERIEVDGRQGEIYGRYENDYGEMVYQVLWADGGILSYRVRDLKRPEVKR